MCRAGKLMEGLNNKQKHFSVYKHIFCTVGQDLGIIICGCMSDRNALHVRGGLRSCRMRSQFHQGTGPIQHTQAPHVNDLYYR